MSTRKSPIGELLHSAPDAPPVVQTLRRIAVREIRSTLQSSVTKEEAAVALGVSRVALWRWLGRFPELTE